MKLHSDTLTVTDIREAFATARRKGLIVGGIELLTLEEKGSRTRANGFEIRLGADYSDGIHKRKTNDNTGNYAATYDEWGWFIAELFDKDVDAVFGTYKGQTGFDADTRYKFVLTYV
jgi:hypothetical protein